jgi:hypothetical protein
MVHEHTLSRTASFGGEEIKELCMVLMQEQKWELVAAMTLHGARQINIPGLGSI